MTIVVEDGTGLAGANSYISGADCEAYCEERGLSFTDNDDGEAALIRATQAVDARYSKQFPGTRTNGRDQKLQWPRTDAVDASGEEIGTDEIPIEVLRATCEFASREFVEPNSVMPDQARGGDIRRIKADTVEIEYAGTAIPGSTFDTVDGIMAPLLKSAVAPFAAYTSRA